MSKDVVEQRIRRAKEAAAKEQMKAFKSPDLIEKYDIIIEKLNAALDILEEMD